MRCSHMSILSSDTQSASANKDPETRAAMLDHIKKLSAASELVCARADGTNPQVINPFIINSSCNWFLIGCALGL